MHNLDDINVMLIGVGPHAQKVYAPWLARHGGSHKANLKVAVELRSQAKQTKDFFGSLAINPTLFFIDPLKFDFVEGRIREDLNRLASINNIKAVIIATEPSTHKAFALWALEQGLNILMDKPITASPNAANNPSAARKILLDYEEICSTYLEARKKNQRLLFSVNVQRRYHPGFEIVLNKLREVTEKTNCPITSVQSSHGDGQWRTPDEVIDIAYHGFTNGYGKASHSGYHFFDIIGQFLKAGTPASKFPEAMEVYTTFSKPMDYISQLNLEDYANIFKKDFTPLYGTKEFLSATTDFGEIDSFSLIRFLRGNAIMSTVQLSLLHQSLSQRAWVEARSDLYKKNGRVKHEYHSIQQGPFQSVQIHSYQSKDEHERNTDADYMVGGNNHFDVHIFRNEKLIGGKKFEKISIDGLIEGGFSELLTTLTKGEVLVEFFDYLQDKLTQPVRSDLLDQWFGVALMSAVYSSGAQNSVVREKIRHER